MLSSIEIILFLILLFFVILILHYIGSFFTDTQKEGLVTETTSPPTTMPIKTTSPPTTMPIKTTSAPTTMPIKTTSAPTTMPIQTPPPPPTSTINQTPQSMTMNPTTNPFDFYNSLKKNNVNVPSIYSSYQNKISNTRSNQEKVNILNEMLAKFSNYINSIKKDNIIPPCIQNTYPPLAYPTTPAPTTTTPAPTTTIPPGINNAISFNNTFYLSVDTPSSNILLNTQFQPFTVEAWINPTTFSSDLTEQNGLFIPSLIGDIDISNNNVYWSFGPINDGRLAFYLNPSNDISFNLISFNTIRNQSTINSYLHIALTCEQNSSDSKYYYYLYMGGQLQQSFFVKSGNTDSKNIDNIAPYQSIRSGNSNICIGYNGLDALFGDVESIKISNKSLYNSSQNNYIQPPLQLENNVDGSTKLIVQYLETDIIDNSPNGYNVMVKSLSNAPLLTPQIVHITQSPCN